MDPAATAGQLARQLAETGRKIVFAESCTAGLAAATLAQTPGISNFLCGSAVTYRGATKTAWLGVPSADIERHTAESKTVAAAMALGVLKETPEAEVAASITGHLGPDAPAKADGVVFIGLALREQGSPKLSGVSSHQLTAEDRLTRQEEAAALLLEEMRLALEAD